MSPKHGAFNKHWVFDAESETQLSFVKPFWTLSSYWISAVLK